MKKKDYKILGGILIIAMSISSAMPVLAYEDVDINSGQKESENSIMGLQEIDGQLYFL